MAFVAPTSDEEVFVAPHTDEESFVAPPSDEVVDTPQDQAPPPAESAFQSFLHPIKRYLPSSLVTAGAGVGAAALTAESGPGALVADVAAGTAAGAGYEKAREMAMTPEEAQREETQLSVNEQTNPWSSKIGTMIGQLPAFLGGGTGMFKAGKALAKEAGEKFAPTALQEVASMAKGGARSSGAGAAGQKVEGLPGSEGISIPEAIAKGAITMGPLGFVSKIPGLAEEATSLVGKTLQTAGHAAGSSEILAHSNALYNSVVNGQPYDEAAIQKTAMSDAPAFALLGAAGHILPTPELEKRAAIIHDAKADPDTSLAAQAAEDILVKKLEAAKAETPEAQEPPTEPSEPSPATLTPETAPSAPESLVEPPIAPPEPVIPTQPETPNEIQPASEQPILPEVQPPQENGGGTNGAAIPEPPIEPATPEAGGAEQNAGQDEVNPPNPPPPETQAAPAAPNPDEIRLTQADEDARRLAQGKLPVDKVKQGTVEDWERLGKKSYLKGDAPALLKDLTDKPRTRTPVEDSVLKHYAGALDKDIEDSDKIIANPDSTEAQREDAQRKKDFAEEQREKIAVAASKSGSAWGASGRALQEALSRDKIPSLDKIIADRLKAKDKTMKTPLSKEERAELRERYKKLTEKAEALAGKEEAKAKEADKQATKDLLSETQKEAEQAKADTIASQTPATKTAKPKFSKRVVDSIIQKAAAARERLKNRLPEDNQARGEVKASRPIEEGGTPSVTISHQNAAVEQLKKTEIGRKILRDLIISPDWQRAISRPEFSAENRGGTTFSAKEYEGIKRAEGFFDPVTGKSVVIRENVRPRPGETPMEAVLRVARHERVGHEGLDALRSLDPKFDSEYRKIIASIPKEELDAIKSRYGNDPDLAVKEWFADEFGKLNPDEIPNPNTTFGRIWQAIKDFLSRLTRQSTKLDQQVRDLMGAVVRHPEALESRRGFGDVMASKPKEAGPLDDYAHIMAEHIANGKDAPAEMKKEFGDAIAGNLPAIEKQARQILREESRLKTPDELKAKLKAAKEADPERTIGKYFAQELAKGHIREAIENGDELTRADLNKKVHADLKEFAPEITEQEARDLRTGYGVQKYPSDNPVDIRLAELNRIDQLFSSIERAQKEKPERPLGTGFKRPKPSPDIRDMQKQLNDAMEKAGFGSSDDPTQLASRRDAIKTRLTNEIEDLDRVREGKAKLRTKEGEPFDYDKPENADLKQLKEHRDALQKIVDAMPENVAATEKAKNESAIKAAQKAEAEWTRRADELEKAGNITGRSEQEPERAQAVKDARQKAADARKRFEDLKKAADTHKSFIDLEEISHKMGAADKRIAELETKLAPGGDLSVEKTEEGPTHPELEKKQARVEQLNKKLAAKRAEAERPAKDAEKAKNDLDDARAKVIELENELQSPDIKRNPVKRKQVGVELQSLREQIKGLQKAKTKAISDQEKPNRELKRADKELQDAKDAVAKLQKKLDADDLSKKTINKRAVSAELAAEREKLKSLNKEMAEKRNAAKIRPSENERRLDQFKKRTKKQIADLKTRRANKDFAKRTRTPKEIELDKEGEQLKIDIAKEKNAFQDENAKYERDQRGYFRKGMDTMVHLSREFKLLHPSTIEKLGGAGLENILTRPIGTAIAQTMRGVPVLRDIHKKAIYEGRASLRSELKGLQGTFNSAKDVLNKAFKGKTDIDWLNNDKHYSEEFKSRVGNLHAAIKEPVRQGIFSRSLQLELEAAHESGLKPEENPLLMQELTSRAYENANMDIFMGDNLLTKGIRGMFAQWRNNKNNPEMGKLMADVAEILLPILNVPTNIFIRTSRLNPLIGLPEAVLRTVQAARRGDLANGAEKLSGRDADLITRALKYGLFGTALAAYAWTHPKNFGGISLSMRHPGGNEDKDLKAGDIKTPFGTLNHHLAHGPVGTFLNVVADSRREYDNFLKKHPKEDGQAAVSAAMWSMIAPVQRLPFVDTILRSFSDQKSLPQHAAEIARGSFLPADTDVAGYFDKDAKGNPIKRTATTPLEEIKLGIPGLRQEVKPSKHQPVAH